MDLLSNVRITEFFIFIQYFLWENEAVEMSNFCEKNIITITVSTYHQKSEVTFVESKLIGVRAGRLFGDQRHR